MRYLTLLEVKCCWCFRTISTILALGDEVTRKRLIHEQHFVVEEARLNKFYDGRVQLISRETEMNFS